MPSAPDVSDAEGAGGATTPTATPTAAAVPRRSPPPADRSVARGDDADLLDLPDDCLQLVTKALWATSGAPAALPIGRVCRRFRRAVNEARPAVTLRWCAACAAAGRRGRQETAAAAVPAGGGGHRSLASTLLDTVALLDRLGGLQHVTLLDAADPPGPAVADPSGEVSHACAAPPTDRAAVWRAVGTALQGAPRLSRMSVSGMAVAAVAPVAANGRASWLTALDVSVAGEEGQPPRAALEARLCAGLAGTAPTLRSLTLSAAGGWSDGTVAALLHRVGGFPCLTTLSIKLGGGPTHETDAGALAATCPAVVDVAFRDGLTVPAGDALRLSRGVWRSLSRVTVGVNWVRGGAGRPIGGLPELVADRSLRRLAIDGGSGGGGGGSMGWGDDVWHHAPLRRLNGVVAALLSCRRLPASVAVEAVALDPADWEAFIDTHRSATDVVSLSLPRRDCAAAVFPHLFALCQLRSLSLGLNVCGIPPSLLRPGVWALPPALADLTLYLHDGESRGFANDGRWRSVVWAVATTAAASPCEATALSRLAVVADGGYLHPEPFAPLVQCIALRELAVHSRDDGPGEVAKLDLHLRSLLPGVTVAVMAGEEGGP